MGAETEARVASRAAVALAATMVGRCSSVLSAVAKEAGSAEVEDAEEAANLGVHRAMAREEGVAEGAVAAAAAAVMEWAAVAEFPVGLVAA